MGVGQSGGAGGDLNSVAPILRARKMGQAAAGCYTHSLGRYRVTCAAHNSSTRHCLMNTFDLRVLRRVSLSAAIGLVAVHAASCRVTGSTGPTFEYVTATGEPAPAGGNFVQFERVQINEAGLVAFTARVSDGVSGQQDGLFVGVPYSLDDVAMQFTPAPAGGNYSSFNQFVLNDAGQVAFRGNLSSGETGIFVGTPGLVQTIAVSGTLSPDGAPFSRFHRDFAFNDAGQIAFPVFVEDGGIGDRLIAGTPGNLAVIAATGHTPVDGGESYVSFSPPMLSNSGRVAFQAALDPTSSRTGLYVGMPGDIQTVAVEGSAGPGGGTFGNPVHRAINDNGEVAFFATLSNGPSTSGYFVGTPNAVQPVALLDAPAPGGGSYTFLGGITLSASGAVGISSGISGAAHTAANFFGLPGAIEPVALGGKPAPGGGNFLSPSLPGSNTSGDLVFRAVLTGPGVTNSNNSGLYARVGGSIIKLIREGDKIPVSASDEFRTVADGGINAVALTSANDGLGHSFTDSGYLALTLTFTDLSTAIFRVRLPQVPEPSCVSLALVAIAAAGLARATTKWR